jgi:chromosomal replication initiation ATPase DnaA
MNIKAIVRTNQEKLDEVQKLLRDSLPIFRELQLTLVRLITLNLKASDVINKVNRYYGVDMLARRENGKLPQTYDVTVPRHLVRYILYEYSPMTLTEISHATGSIDKHSIALTSSKVIREMLTYDTDVRTALYTIMEELIQENDLVQPVHKIYRTKKLFKTEESNNGNDTI